MESQSARQLAGIFFRGLAMGAADVVPGVSGGTVAFITGIYERLLNAIKNCDHIALQLLFSRQLPAAWARVDGTFLLTLLAGIACSVILLANIISGLMQSHPHWLWSFFFGLIAASALLLSRNIENWNRSLVGALLAGLLVAVLLGRMTPAEVEVSMPMVFFSGSIAICAMILPGISGSFILLMLGMYAPVIEAIGAFDVALLGVFASGCVAGLLLFSRLLSWLYHYYRALTLSTLTGFLFGSLALLWPWQNAVVTVTDRHGDPRVLQRDPVLPWNYTGEADTLVCIALMAGAVALVGGLALIQTKLEQKNENL